MQKSAIAAALAVTATAVVAQAPSGSSKARAEDDPNERVCVVQRETGSLTRATRVCRTRAEWEEERRANRQAMERVQSFKTTSGN